MRIAILTDSNSGILNNNDNLYIMNMPVIIDNEVYYENENLDTAQFFELLSSNHSITTSQPSIQNLLDTWDDLLTKYDQIVYIPMSSALSSSYNTGQMLSKDYDNKVFVVDNRRISINLNHSINEALELVKLGYTAENIKNILEETADDSVIYVAVDNLKYLVRGGRVTKRVASIAKITGIKPLLIIKGGKIDSYSNAHGIKKCKHMLINEIIKYMEKYQNERCDFVITASGSLLEKELVDEWLDKIHEKIPNVDIQYDPLPLSICAHTGENTYAIGISKKHKFEKLN